MNATKLVLAGIAIVICAVLMLTTITRASQKVRRTVTVPVRDSNNASRIRTGLIADPLSIAVKLAN